MPRHILGVVRHHLITCCIFRYIYSCSPAFFTTTPDIMQLGVWNFVIGFSSYLSLNPFIYFFSPLWHCGDILQYDEGSHHGCWEFLVWVKIVYSSKIGRSSSHPSTASYGIRSDPCTASDGGRSGPLHVHLMAGQTPVSTPCNCILWSVTCIPPIGCSCRLADLHYSIDLGNSQLPVRESNSSFENFNFQLQNWDLSNRIMELSCPTTEFNAGRNYHLPAGRLNTTSLGDIVNIRSQNTILRGKVSISGQRIQRLPTSGRIMLCPFDRSNFRPDNWDLSSRLWELSTGKTWFNTDRNYHLLARTYYTLCLGGILNFRSENDAMFCEKSSTSG